MGYYRDALVDGPTLQRTALNADSRKSVSFAGNVEGGRGLSSRSAVEGSAGETLRKAQDAEAAALEEMRLRPPAPGNLSGLPYSFNGLGDFTRRSFSYM